MFLHPWPLVLYYLRLHPRRKIMEEKKTPEPKKPGIWRRIGSTLGEIAVAVIEATLYKGPR